MVLGDRLEMLAASCAALAERIPIAHVHGGETAPGIWDEQIRHAITKMAQVHFCATKTAGRRISKWGRSRPRACGGGAGADEAVGYFEEMRWETMERRVEKGFRRCWCCILRAGMRWRNAGGRNGVTGVEEGISR